MAAARSATRRELFTTSAGVAAVFSGRSIARPVTSALFVASVLVIATFGRAAEDDSRWVRPLCKPLAVDSNGPFVEPADGSLTTIDFTAS